MPTEPIAAAATLTATINTAAPADAHIPDDLIYGPVVSRRFGRSLGVGCSPPGQWACTWQCRYCQLHELPRAVPVDWPSVTDLDHQLAVTLRQCDALDAVTIAGAGEPTLHPAIDQVLGVVADHAWAAGARSVLLTSGEGWRRTPDRLAKAAAVVDEVWLKVDPGPAPLGWSIAQRQHWLQQFERSQWQCMLYHDEMGGNQTPACQAAWLALLRQCQPTAVDLMTVDRAAAVGPVSAATIGAWATAAQAAAPMARIRAFGSRG